jgi:large conductance mechanosensitive channel
MLKEFRQFILRGNLIELAVAVVIGTALGAVVMAFTKGLVTPLIAAAGGETNFSESKFEINGSEFLYGQFIDALLAFLIIAAVVFFFVIKPVNALMDRLQPAPAVDVETRACPECISDIPISATRCAFCTSKVDPISSPPPATAT